MTLLEMLVKCIEEKGYHVVGDFGSCTVTIYSHRWTYTTIKIELEGTIVKVRHFQAIIGTFDFADPSTTVESLLELVCNPHV